MIHRTLLSVVGIVTVLGCQTLRADSACESLNLPEQRLAIYDFSAPLPTLALGHDIKLPVSSIRVHRQPIFETPENRLHRVANRFHAQTREAVILDVLPFVVGESVGAVQLAEAERVLRAKAYLFDAAVVVSRRCADGIVVQVVVRDVWTLNPRLLFSRSGGENELGVGISDTNWLGTGKAFSVGFEKDEDRSGVRVFYADPNVLGSRWALTASVLDNDDGANYFLEVERPFFALNTPYAFGVKYREFNREQGLYFLSDKIWELDALSRTVRAFVGKSGGRQDGWVSRWLLGVAHEDHEFTAPAGFPDRTSDRTFTYPFVAYQRIRDAFDEGVNVDRIQRTEDIELGARLYLELGYAPDGFAGDGDHMVSRGSYQYTRWLDNQAKTLVRAGVNFDGKYDLDNHGSEDLVASTFVAYRRLHHERFSFLARASATFTRNLSIDRQLLLGGDSGLRGYPNRYQPGDRAFRVTVEERYYSDIYPFDMFRLGGAVFVDAGRSWFVDEAPLWIPDDRSGDHFDTLTNVGFGLRLESTRTRRDRIMHLDIAFPLVDGPDVKGVEITLSAKQSL